MLSVSRNDFAGRFGVFFNSGVVRGLPGARFDASPRDSEPSSFAFSERHIVSHIYP